MGTAAMRVNSLSERRDGKKAKLVQVDRYGGKLALKPFQIFRIDINIFDNNSPVEQKVASHINQK